MSNLTGYISFKVNTRDWKRAVDIFFRNTLASSKWRTINEEEEFYEYENNTENAMIANIAQSVEIIVMSRDKLRVVRKAKVDRTQQKEQWANGNLLWSEEKFKSRL